MNPSSLSSRTRRQFLRDTGATVVGGALAAHRVLADEPAAVGATLKVGLVGCGGRGTGAAAQALAADPNVKLVAMGDAFEDRLQGSLETLQKQVDSPSKIEVPPERRFVGFEAYHRVIEHSDVVLLATPPHFRPIHLQAAVAAGKHVFAEKPVAVDGPGVRSVLASCELARQKKLSVVSGLCLRYSKGFSEAIRRIHEGALGEIRTLQANDFRGPIWVKPRRPEWTDMEWQMHNWYYFTWLSGDFNVEQHVHFLDICAWIMKGEYPVRAIGLGGRQQRTGPEYGNIYDHHSVIYEYANGVRLFSNCRQMPGCQNDMSCQVMGAKGMADISETRIRFVTDTEWVYRGENNDVYQTEHDHLFSSIRTGQPLNQGEYMAKSTLMAILGRMATYTGQAVTWDEALHSTENLSPEGYAWNARPPASPIAIPGMAKRLKS